jgi:hypothetical protein
VIAEDASVLHMNLPIIDAAGGVLDPGFIEEAGASSEEMMSVAEVAPGMAPSRDLEQKLSVSGTQLDSDLLYAYQAVWVLASALERAGSAEGPALHGVRPGDGAAAVGRCAPSPRSNVVPAREYPGHGPARRSTLTIPTATELE